MGMVSHSEISEAEEVEHLLECISTPREPRLGFICEHIV